VRMHVFDFRPLSGKQKRKKILCVLCGWFIVVK
jgi:hypothetical protein